MYSENDWRLYSGGALMHGQWKWPDGKNSKEYNRWYYLNHKYKWLKDLSSEDLLAMLENGELDEEMINGLLGEQRLNEAAMATLRDIAVDKSTMFNKRDPVTGIPLKRREMSADEDMERVNPGFMNLSEDTKNNCMLCTMSYDLRRRGFDVMAAKSEEPLNADLVNRVYKDLTYDNWVSTQASYETSGAAYYGTSREEYVRECSDNMIHYLESTYDDGARGYMQVMYTANSGHAIAWEIDGGEVVIRDCQTNKKYTGDAIFEDFMIYTNGVIAAVRTDDKEIDPDAVKEIYR